MRRTAGRTRYNRLVDYVVKHGAALRGGVTVPGDKSISHRAIVLSAIAEGRSRIRGLLRSEDVLATLRAFRQMGVAIDESSDGSVTVEGVGRDGLRSPAADLDLGNSGTAMRLLAGLLAGQNLSATLTGDESLLTRPMRRVAVPLERMGARIATSADGRPPLRIQPGGRLRGIRYRMPQASAQVKSALLLAGMYASGETCVEEPAVTRDHTERMMATFGCGCRRNGNVVCVSGGGALSGVDLDVPGDLSSAAFFIAGGALAPGSNVMLSGVGINPTRTGVLDILERMGADVRIENRRSAGNEPVADIHVRPMPLTGVEIPAHQVSLAIDEFPAIAVVAACAEGQTRVRGAEELRHKESDRIRAIVCGLRALGIDAEERDDGMDITGARFKGGTVDSFGDHRIAMAFCMAALRADGPVVVRNCDNIATSFPGFVDAAARLGMDIAVP